MIAYISRDGNILILRVLHRRQAWEQHLA